MSRAVFAIVVCTGLAPSLASQPPVTPSGLTTAAMHTLPATSVGGLYFDALGTTLYVGDALTGAILAYPLIRSATTGQITGFGISTTVTIGSSPEGLDNIGGTWMWTNWPANTLGQFSLASGASAVESLGAAGVPPSTGGLRVVPPWMPNAGAVLVASYDAGNVYQVTLTPNPNGNGTYMVVANSATVFAATPIGGEGIAFVPSGPYTGCMLHSNYDNGDVWLYITNPATGQPTGQSFLLISGTPWATGVVFDPLTGDLFVGSYTSANNLFHFSGTVRGDYQLNQAGSSFDIGGLQGGLLAPATTMAATGQPISVNWTSTNAGLPFDIALATSLVPSGLVTPGGQVVNIDLGAPYAWVFGGTFANAFFPVSVIITATGNPTAVQMGVVDPTYASGLALSQPNLVQ
jgi:hypothetical protein